MTAIDDLRSVIESSIINQPRSLQKWAGPSELALNCERCLVHKLAGTPTIDHDKAAWMPFIGNAVHAELACILLRHEQVRADLGMPPRYLVEHRVSVGVVGGIERTGSVDVFDTADGGHVIDFKVTGASTMTKARKGDINKAYMGQIQLYGLGMENAGYDVIDVTLLFLPRNGFTLADALPVTWPYSRAAALAVLARADGIATDISTRGVQAVLADVAPHSGAEFSCSSYPDLLAGTTGQETGRLHRAVAGQLSGLVS